MEEQEERELKEKENVIERIIGKSKKYIGVDNE